MQTDEIFYNLQALSQTIEGSFLSSGEQISCCCICCGFFQLFFFFLHSVAEKSFCNANASFFPHQICLDMPYFQLMT